MLENDDVIWFRQRSKRQARLRHPVAGEFEQAYRLLGDHLPGRRRVLVWRIPKDNPGRNLVADGLMRIPFLVNADESIEDHDFILLGILEDIIESSEGAPSQHGVIVTGAGGAYLGDGHGA